MELTTTEALVGALAIAVVLAVLHVLAPWIRQLPLVPESATGSFAGGLAVAYVFVHLLPEVAAGNEAVGEALSDVLRPTPLTDLAIFLVALTGFTVFLGLERLARRAAAPPATAAASADGRSGREPAAGVYWLHLGSFAFYNGLITYTMPLRLRTGLLFGLLFAAAMGLHFVLTDRGLQEHYPRRFTLPGRLVLAAGLVAGWVVAVVAAPTSALVVALLTALLAGSVLLNVFKEEIPSGRRSSFGWFLTGLVFYTALLALITALEG